jgi:hypothetical protein
METKDYELILRKEHEDLVNNSVAGVSFENYSCLVDCRYRCDFGLPPQIDDKAEFRLKSAAVKVGRELIELEEEALWQSELEAKLDYMKERLLLAVEDYLKYKDERLEAPYPLNRRFKRKDVMMLEEKHLEPEEIDEFGGFGEAFTILLKEGYYRIVEEGGHTKHDIFEALVV